MIDRIFPPKELHVDKGEKFTCALCGKVDIADRSDEEAMSEMRLHFGDQPRHELEVVCDECWNKIHPDRN